MIELPVAGQRELSAFSLIELLVAVAVLSLLISILMPSLMSAQRLAKMAACQNGIYSVGVASILYSEDNAQVLLPSSFQGGQPWFDRLVQRRYSQQANFTAQGGCPWAPRTYYTGPSNCYDVYYLPNPTDHMSSYGIVGWLTGWFTAVARPGFQLPDNTGVYDPSIWNNRYVEHGARMADYGRYRRHSADVVLFHCSHLWFSDPYGWGGMQVYNTLGIGYYHSTEAVRPYTRHGGKALPMWFADGHVEAITPEEWTWDRSGRCIEGYTMNWYNSTGRVWAGPHAGPWQPDAN